MADELKKSVVPWLREQGFKGSLPHFRRHRDGAFDLLTFQFDLYGGGYMIEIAQCPEGGIVMPWGKAISASRATAHDVNPSRRKHIVVEDTSGTDGWFRFDRLPYRRVAELTIAKLSDPAIWQNLPPLAPPDQLHRFVE